MDPNSATQAATRLVRDTGLAAAHREAAWKARASASLMANERQARGMRHVAVLHEVIADRLESGELIP